MSNKSRLASLLTMFAGGALVFALLVPSLARARV